MHDGIGDSGHSLKKGRLVGIEVSSQEHLVPGCFQEHRIVDPPRATFDERFDAGQTRGVVRRTGLLLGLRKPQGAHNHEQETRPPPCDDRERGEPISLRSWSWIE